MWIAPYNREVVAGQMAKFSLENFKNKQVLVVAGLNLAVVKGEYLLRVLNRPSWDHVNLSWKRTTLSWRRTNLSRRKVSFREQRPTCRERRRVCLEQKPTYREKRWICREEGRSSRDRKMKLSRQFILMSSKLSKMLQTLVVTHHHYNKWGKTKATPKAHITDFQKPTPSFQFIAHFYGASSALKDTGKTKASPTFQFVTRFQDATSALKHVEKTNAPPTS